MIVKEAIAEVISQKKEKVSYERFGNALNLTRQRIGQILEENLTENQILQIEKYFDVNLTNVKVISNEPKIKADYYPDVFGSCGGGAFVLSETKEQIEIPLKCFVKPFNRIKKYSVIRSRGTSMQPYIFDLDCLIIEHCEADAVIQDDKVYVFAYDNQIFIKRLYYNVDEIIVKSDNPDPIFKVKYIAKEQMNDFILIGQVVGIMRDCR